MGINFGECFRYTREPFQSEIGEKKIFFFRKVAEAYYIF